MFYFFPIAKKKHKKTHSTFYHIQVQILRRNFKQEQKSVLRLNKSPDSSSLLGPLLPGFGIEIQGDFLKPKKHWKRGHF